MLASLSFIFSEQEQIHTDVCSLFMKGWIKLYPPNRKLCGPKSNESILECSVSLSIEKKIYIYIISGGFMDIKIDQIL